MTKQGPSGAGDIVSSATRGARAVLATTARAGRGATRRSGNLYRAVEDHFILSTLGGKPIMMMRWRKGLNPHGNRLARALTPWRRGQTLVKRPALLRPKKRGMVTRMTLVALAGALLVLVPPYVATPIIVVSHVLAYLFRGLLDPHVEGWRINIWWAAEMAAVDLGIVLVAGVTDALILGPGQHGAIYTTIAGLALLVAFLSTWLAWLVDFMVVAEGRFVMRSEGLGLFRHITSGGTTRETVAQRWFRIPGHYFGFDKTAGGDKGLKQFGPVNPRAGEDFAWFVLDNDQKYLDGGKTPSLRDMR